MSLNKFSNTKIFSPDHNQQFGDEVKRCFGFPECNLEWKDSRLLSILLQPVLHCCQYCIKINYGQEYVVACLLEVLI